MKTGIGLALAVATGVSMAAGARHLGAPQAEAGEAVAVVELGVVPGADNLLRAKRLAYRLREPGTLATALRDAPLPDGAPWTADELVAACGGQVDARLDTDVLWISIHVSSGPLEARDDVANVLARWAERVTGDEIEMMRGRRRAELEEKITRLNASMRMIEVDKRHVLESAAGSEQEARRLDALRRDISDELNVIEKRRLLDGELVVEDVAAAKRIRAALAEIDPVLQTAAVTGARIAEYDAEIAVAQADKAAAQREREQLSRFGPDGALRIVRLASEPAPAR